VPLDLYSGPDAAPFMPQLPDSGALLEGPSQDAFVEYWRCDRCGHIWTRDKRNPNLPHKDTGDALR